MNSSEKFIGRTCNDLIILCDPYLAYLARAKGTSSQPSNEKSIFKLFSECDIKMGKKILYDSCGEVFPKRTFSSLRSELEAHHKDVLDKMTVLDTAGKEIIYACQAEKLEKVPRTIPEEASIDSIAERLKNVEDVVKNMFGVVTNINTKPSFAEIAGSSSVAGDKSNPQSKGTGSGTGGNKLPRPSVANKRKAVIEIIF